MRVGHMIIRLDCAAAVQRSSYRIRAAAATRGRVIRRNWRIPPAFVFGENIARFSFRNQQYLNPDFA
jgi:hypothetical protein